MATEDVKLVEDGPTEKPENFIKNYIAKATFLKGATRAEKDELCAVLEKHGIHNRVALAAAYEYERKGLEAMLVAEGIPIGVRSQLYAGQSIFSYTNRYRWLMSQLSLYRAFCCCCGNDQLGVAHQPEFTL